MFMEEFCKNYDVSGIIGNMTFFFFQCFTVKYDTGNPFLTFTAIVLKV